MKIGLGLISQLFIAMQKGRSVDNPTKWRWANILIGLVLFGLWVAHSLGYFLEVNDSMIIDLIVAILVIASSIVQDENIGVPESLADKLRHPFKGIGHGTIQSDSNDKTTPGSGITVVDDLDVERVRSSRVSSDVNETVRIEPADNHGSDDRFWGNTNNGSFWSDS